MPGMAGSTPAVWGDRIFLTNGEGNSLNLLNVDSYWQRVAIGAVIIAAAAADRLRSRH